MSTLSPVNFQEVMNQPVLAADGYTYERKAMEQWMKVHGTSPKTGARLAHKNLTDNHTVKSLIHEWFERRRKAKKEQG